jgi:hypothetical protein
MLCGTVRQLFASIVLVVVISRVTRKMLYYHNPDHMFGRDRLEIPVLVVVALVPSVSVVSTSTIRLKSLIRNDSLTTSSINSYDSYSSTRNNIVGNGKKYPKSYGRQIPLLKSAISINNEKQDWISQKETSQRNKYYRPSHSTTIPEFLRSSNRKKHRRLTWMVEKCRILLHRVLLLWRNPWRGSSGSQQLFLGKSLRMSSWHQFQHYITTTKPSSPQQQQQQQHHHHHRNASNKKHDPWTIVYFHAPW